ncbi:hypothetical protein [Pseudoalteromonas fuliginea]|uniref:hypothetical protein n=1 Tax=Pseudoalteromonas fuliginea TaxID=1872678 RepID=UPI00165D832E|nr:hypothetical protein [Pseudoalteromonas fuliginea]
MSFNVLQCIKKVLPVNNFDKNVIFKRQHTGYGFNVWCLSVDVELAHVRSVAS